MSATTLLFSGCGGGWRGGSASTRRDHATHPAGRRAAQGAAAHHLVDARLVVVADGLAVDLVGSHTPHDAAHDRAAREVHGVIATVVEDLLGFAFDQLFPALALLFEVAAPALAAGGGGRLRAIRGLADFDAVGADGHRALGDVDVAGEDVQALAFFDTGVVRREMQGLRAIGLFGP